MRLARIRSLLFLMSVLATLACGRHAAPGGSASAASGTPQYPVTHRSDHVDTYHGVEVPDPYRWLEREDSDETRDWLASQERLFDGYVSGPGLLGRLVFASGFVVEPLGAPERFGGDLARVERRASGGDADPAPPDSLDTLAASPGLAASPSEPRLKSLASRGRARYAAGHT